MNDAEVINFLAACDAIIAGKKVQVWTHADQWEDVHVAYHIDKPITLRVFLSQYRVRPEGEA